MGDGSLMRCVELFRAGAGPALALLLITAVSCSQTVSFQGTELDPTDVAPSFRLTDQFGDAVALADFDGKVVALAFLYTQCPDVCPLVTETLRRTHERLGDDAAQVQFLAVSVDPQRDSVDMAHRYSLERDMQHRWRFLVGSEEQLSLVWKSYWLDPVRDAQASQDGPDPGHSSEEAAHSGSTPEGNPYLVSHNAPVFLIDREGRRRVVFTNPSLDPEPLVHDIRILIK